MNRITLITFYLAAVVAANLLVARFGAGITIFNAFVLIALDLTSRDSLHEAWHGQHLWRNMALLILTGSILSALLNSGALHIAIASFAAFSLSGLSDTITYALLGGKSKFVKMNGSNLVSAAVDSAAFALLAFIVLAPTGTALPVAVVVNIIAAQYIAKVAGGLIWSWLLTRRALRLRQT